MCYHLTPEEALKLDDLPGMGRPPAKSRPQS